MSVINQMLRDLDKQQGKIPSPRVTQPVFARSTRGAGWRWLVPLCLLILLGLQWQPQWVASAWTWLRGVVMSETAAPTAVSPSLTSTAVPEAKPSSANNSQPQSEVLAAAVAPQNQTDPQPHLATDPAVVAASTVTAASPVEPERAPKPELPETALQPSAASVVAASSSSVTIAAEEPNETPAPARAAAAEATTSFEPESWTEPLAMAPSQLQIEQLPESPDLQLTLLQQRAQQAVAEQQLLQAVALWQQYQQLAPERALAYEQLAQLWWQQQQWPQLAQVLAQAQSRQIQSTTLALQQARLAASQQQWAQVLTALAQWPATAPLTEALPLRAQAQQQLGDYPSALASYQQLVQLQPDSARAWLGQALVYDQLQQSQAAVASYRQALALGGLAPASRQFIQQRLAQTE